MEKFNNLFEKKKTKILLFIISDIIAILLSSILAIWIRFDFGTIPQTYLVNSYNYIISDIILMLSVFYVLRLYTSVWQYASVIEMLDVIGGCLIFECLTFMYKFTFNISMPRSYYLIQAMLLMIFVGGSRFFFRVLRTIVLHYENRSKNKNTMIIGAGSAGRMLIEEISVNKNYDNKILCIIDDNKEKTGTYIRNIPVVGNRKTIPSFCEKYKIEEIIIAIPSASKNKISTIVDECQKTKCSIKILPVLSHLLDENDPESAKEMISQLRPLSYEDFLGRNEIVVNTKEITDNIEDKVILVTGGGGSIGSELCRQIASHNPKQLIIFDIYENNAYDIQQELVRRLPNLNLEVVIGSVRDYDRLEQIFKTYNPQVVFHAAAHKHVPLMEISPNECIKNNCLGTLNAAKLADVYEVEKFVLISTDKAVRPTNIMGASKH